MESMTGYGESTFTLEGVKFRFRIRSLNNRFIETVYHLPQEISWLEVRADEIIKQKFYRGKVQIDLEADKQLPVNMDFNLSAIQSYKAAFQSFYKKKNINIPMEVLVQIPNVFDARSQNWQAYQQKFEFYFMRALVKTQRQRLREGRKLKTWLRPKIRLLQRYNQKILILQDRYNKRKRKEIRVQLNSIFNAARKEKGNLPLSKIKSEIKDEVLTAFYSDITEEIERLQIHLNEINSSLDSKEAQGKKLEFYFQEVLREANTLTSKTNDTKVNQIGILMKVEIEKIREQIRNLV